MGFRRAVARAARFAGLDADVLHTMVFRSWSIVAGAVMVLLIPAFLTELEQGYYYTFASLLTLQMFFDLGMNQLILQFVSHYTAHARTGANPRLSALVALLRRWYAVAAVAFFVLVSVGGAWFLARDLRLATTEWLGPWLALTAATAANLFLSALLAVMEGSGNVASVARLRLRQSVLGHLSVWLALAIGGQLWAAPLLPIVCAIYSTCWLKAQGQLAAAPHAAPAAERPSWRREILPLQWRLALSWIAGYFIFQLLTPLAFAQHGAAEAGRLGITLAVFNAVLTAGQSWVNAKFPALSMHLARHERADANRLFRTVTSRAMGFTTFLSAAVLLVLALLPALAPGFAHRFASLPVASCIALVTLANTFVFAAAGYLRAHKEEPMVWVSLVSGVATAVAVIEGARLGVLPMMVLYAAVTVFITVPWTFILFRSYARRPA